MDLAQVAGRTRTRMAAYLAVPSEGRVPSKLLLRQRTIDNLLQHREVDARLFVGQSCSVPQCKIYACENMALKKHRSLFMYTV